METKKTNRANLEKKRSVFFQTGLLLTLGFVLLAFEWKVSPRISDIEWKPIPRADVVIIDVPITRAEQKELPPPPKPVMDLSIVDDDVVVPEEIHITVEIGEKTAIEPGVFEEPTITETDEPDIFYKVEEMPLFNGKPAEEGFREYIRDNLVYPQIAIENGITGKVLVQFVVDQYGNITNVQIVRGADSSLNNEAVRLITSSPKWKAGIQQGKPVKVQFTFPIQFKLQ